MNYLQCLTDLALTKSQFAPVIRLNNGVKMPVLGLGTYLVIHTFTFDGMHYFY